MDLCKASELQPYILQGIERTGNRLGSGSFGYVVEVIHAGARCAGKVIHEGLIDSRGVGYKNMIRKIEYECRIMCSLRHPNIVQFLGICFFDESSVPVLVMECLDANLESLLTQTSNLSIHAKINVLLDIAKGLVYLHSHTPPIVHRDLTARNVLLTNTLLAKIADLGNSRIIESNALTHTLSTVPGTLVYMPPEAMANPPQYNEKLDIFSFGHLALYTALQDFPCELLLGVYNDPKNPNRACARNEVERRFRYVGNLRTKFGPNHAVTKLVTDCLHNHPQTRPSAIQVLDQIQKLQREYRSGGMKFSLADFIHNIEEEKVRYGQQSTLQRSLDRIQNGGMDMLEKEGRNRMGRNRWKQYAFQISNSTLQYFSRIDRGPEEEVQLDKITAVDCLDDDPNYPYQFMVQIAGKKSWKLKSDSEEARQCWIKALTPKSSPHDRCIEVYRDLYEEDKRYAVNERDERDNFEVDAYAYVQMAPPNNQPIPVNQPRVYQQLVDRNKPQPYASYEEIHGANIHEQQAKQEVQNTYDVPKNRGFEMQPSIAPQIPKYDIPRIRKKACAARDMPMPKHQEQQQNQLLPPGSGSGDQPDSRRSSFNVENMDSEQIQLLISQLQEMGVVPVPKDPVSTAQDEDLYPEVDDMYDTISDEEERIYDDISDPKPGHMYVNLAEVQATYTAKGAVQSSNKVKPTVPPRTHRRGASAIPRTKSIGSLLRETSIFNDQLLDDAADPESKDYAHHPSWMKASTTSSTVRADDPLLSAGEGTLYISRDSLANMVRIGEGQFGLVYKAVLRNYDGRVVDVAIKTIRKYNSQKEMDNFIREMTVMSQLIHPNIIQLYGVIKENDWIVLEYLPNGDLKTFLSKHHRSVQSLMKYMTDVAMGMLYLSEKGLIHRDLAARNVIVGENETCKVADFYISSSILLCPLRWMAPESIEYKQFSTASDVWSYGILLWEMFNPTEIPYPNFDDVQLTAKLARGYTMPVPDQCPSNIAKIMKSCWKFKPSDRPSFTLITVLLTRLNLRRAV